MPKHDRTAAQSVLLKQTSNVFEDVRDEFNNARLKITQSSLARVQVLTVTCKMCLSPMQLQRHPLYGTM